MTSSSAPVPRAKSRHWGWKIGAALILIPLLVIGFWIWGALGYSYSTGERTGYVQKISQKGWVCKTWEGELAMNPVPGSPPQLFAFTIRSDSLAKVIESLSGKQLTLTYSQHVGLPTNCFGDTEYFVTGVRALQ